MSKTLTFHVDHVQPTSTPLPCIACALGDQNPPSRVAGLLEAHTREATTRKPAKKKGKRPLPSLPWKPDLFKASSSLSVCGLTRLWICVVEEVCGSKIQMGWLDISSGHSTHDRCNGFTRFKRAQSSCPSGRQSLRFRVPTWSHEMRFLLSIRDNDHFCLQEKLVHHRNPRPTNHPPEVLHWTMLLALYDGRRAKPSPLGISSLAPVAQLAKQTFDPGGN